MSRHLRAFWINVLLHLLGAVGAGLVVSLFGLVVRRDIWNLQVPFWLLPLTVAVLAVPFIYLLRKLREEPHNVLVMLSAFERHPYFAEVLRYIVACLDETRTREGLALQVVFNAPRAPYDPAKQKLHLDEAVRRRREYVGALIVPVAPSETKRDLADFVQRFGRPVVFFDTNPCLRPEEYTSRSCFIGIDDRAGGELAAAAMAHELRRLGVARPRILVLPGGFHEAREHGFEQALRQKIEDPLIVIGDPSHFDRGTARRTTLNLLAAAAREGQRYDGAFCTGDEMALGFIEAVTERGAGVSDQLVVIGYDGNHEARHTIDHRNSPFKNTVVQDTRRLGEAVVRQLAYLLERERDPSTPPESLLRPHLYRGVPGAA